MICLALDFAGPVGQVAIADSERCLNQDERPAGPGTVEGIVPFLLSAISRAGLRPEDIQHFVATVGPGSFTGIRAGLAAAAGLAQATGRPLSGATVFDAIALSLDPGGGLALIALDGRRRELFVQARAADGAPLGEPANLAPEDLDRWSPAEPLRLAGSAAGAARDALAAAGRPADSLELAPGLDRVDTALLAMCGAEGRFAPDRHPPIPFYGREPDVSRPA